MAVTQYMGARYVPLFADPLEWDNTKTYEPLTIVYNNGNSYTSRQYVPVGIEIGNERYWALTGNYNAQIEQYRSEVQKFSGDIRTNAQAIKQANTSIAANTEQISQNKTGIEANESAITEAKADIARNKTDIARNKSDIARNKSDIAQNKTDITQLKNGLESVFPSEFACIGDSYLEGYAESGNVTDWGTLIGQKTGATVYRYYRGGIGYDANGLAKLTSALTEHPNIPLVIIGLGINNRDTAFDRIKTGFASMLDVMVAHTDTRFYVFPCIMAGPHAGNKLLQVEKAVNDALASHTNPGNITLTNGCWTWLIDDDSNFDHSDWLHPTQQGQNIIASSMIVAIKGGDPTRYSARVPVTAVNGGNIVCTRTMNMLSFTLNNMQSDDGKPFATITNQNLKMMQGYGFLMDSISGSTKAFNTSNDGYSLRAAYGNMAKGYGTYINFLTDKD